MRNLDHSVLSSSWSVKVLNVNNKNVGAIIQAAERVYNMLSNNTPEVQLH